MSLVLKPVHIKKIFIQSQNADPSPPLGTILGNLGVNTVLFCTQFNQVTKNLPSYYKVNVMIFVYENRTFSFKLGIPSISFIFSLLKFEKLIKIFVYDRLHEQKINCVSLYTVLLLAKLKFPNGILKNSLSILLGVLKSLNISVQLS